MIGEYWCTGITVEWGYAGASYAAGTRTELWGWRASLRFFDRGFVRDNLGVGQVSTEGALYTRHYVGELHSRPTTEEHSRVLALAIDTLKRDAEAMGIRFGSDVLGPTVYGVGDGEHPERPLPSGWRALINSQSVRLGWRAGHREPAREEGE